MNLQTSYYVRFSTLKVICLVLLTAGMLVSERSQAQNSPETTATYGRGVHAYFDNRTELAEEHFSQVINAGSTDPRAYYYRAMTRIRNGRQQEAEEDMRIGAAYEASNPGNRHAIGKALERVQGPHRRLLERFRQQARMDRLQQRQQQTRRRYEQLKQREPTVLRREIPAPLEQLLEPSLDLPTQLESPNAGELPGSAAPTAKAAPTPAPKTPSPKVDEDDPFAEGSSDNDIFGEPEPDEEAEEPAQEEDDPFAMAAPSVDSGESSSALFGEADPETELSLDPLQLRPSDQIESGQMASILGRVAGSLFPWRGLEIPSMGPEAGADVQQVGDIEFGPFDEQAEVIQVSVEEPVEGNTEGNTEAENLFGEAADDSVSEPEDDLFGIGTTDEELELATETAEDENSESEETESKFEDPFGDF